MSYILASSGGKDSTLALDRALRQGLDVRWLLNVVHGDTGRVRFHGVRAELIDLQARVLGLEPHQPFTRPTGFEPAFLEGLGELVTRGAKGIVFGNIHLADVRAWYEERTTALGLEHVEPLWGESPELLVGELLGRGYRTCIVSVDLSVAPREWLGRELDDALFAEILACEGMDPAGEKGEFHSYVFDGPLFSEPIDLSTGIVHEQDGHAMIELVPNPTLPAG